MLWFDEAKDYGFILTEDEERLYVNRDGFVDGAPVGRCARLPVRLMVAERDGRRMATEVSLVSSTRRLWPEPRANPSARGVGRSHRSGT